MCAELLLGQPLFPGESGVDQLVEIIKVLGTPQREEIEAMNPNYTEFQFPQIKAHSWNKIFRSRTPPEAIDLLEKMLVYDPKMYVYTVLLELLVCSDVWMLTILCWNVLPSQTGEATRSCRAPVLRRAPTRESGAPERCASATALQLHASRYAHLVNLKLW